MLQFLLFITVVNSEAIVTFYKEQSYQESDEDKYDDKEGEEKMDPTGCSVGH